MKITGSHVHGKSGSNSETMLDRETLLLQLTNRKSYMTCRVVAVPMTLSDLQDYARIASFLKCDFSYSSAAGDKTSSDIASRAVPLFSRGCFRVEAARAEGLRLGLGSRGRDSGSELSTSKGSGKRCKLPQWGLGRN